MVTVFSIEGNDYDKEALVKEAIGAFSLDLGNDFAALFTDVLKHGRSFDGQYIGVDGNAIITAVSTRKVINYVLPRDHDKALDAIGQFFQVAREIQQSIPKRSVSVLTPVLDKAFELKGHFRAIGCIAFSPDGKLLVSAGSSEGKVVFWDIATQRQAAEFGAYNETVSITFGDTARTVVTASRQGAFNFFTLDPLSKGSRYEILRSRFVRHCVVSRSLSFAIGQTIGEPGWNIFVANLNEATAKDDVFVVSATKLSEKEGSWNGVLLRNNDNKAWISTYLSHDIRAFDISPWKISSHILFEDGDDKYPRRAIGVERFTVASNEIWLALSGILYQQEFVKGEFKVVSRILAVLPLGESAAEKPMERLQILFTWPTSGEEKGYTECIYAIAASDDSSMMAWIVEHQREKRYELIVWDINCAKAIAEATLPSGGTLVFSPSNEVIATSAEDGTISVWNLTQTEAFSPSNDEVIASSADDGARFVGKLPQSDVSVPQRKPWWKLW